MSSAIETPGYYVAPCLNDWDWPNYDGYIVVDPDGHLDHDTWTECHDQAQELADELNGDLPGCELAVLAELHGLAPTVAIRRAEREDPSHTNKRPRAAANGRGHGTETSEVSNAPAA